MNLEQRQVAADPQTKAPDFGYESACRLLSSTTIIAIYYVPAPNRRRHLAMHLSDI